MTAESRRSAVLAAISSTNQPISATVLAKQFGVSRQIIVGDVALLRATGAKISATPRGYVIQQDITGIIRQVATRHNGDQMEEELNIIVDHGCTVLDVIVDHPIYGQLAGQLQLSSRYDIQQFVARSAQAQPLSLLTEGIHLHTLSCPSEEAYERVCDALQQVGLLLDQ